MGRWRPRRSQLPHATTGAAVPPELIPPSQPSVSATDAPRPPTKFLGHAITGGRVRRGPHLGVLSKLWFELVTAGRSSAMSGRRYGEDIARSYHTRGSFGRRWYTRCIDGRTDGGRRGDDDASIAYLLRARRAAQGCRASLMADAGDRGRRRTTTTSSTNATTKSTRARRTTLAAERNRARRRRRLASCICRRAFHTHTHVAMLLAPCVCMHACCQNFRSVNLCPVLELVDHPKLRFDF
jgi:hypothetical protein